MKSPLFDRALPMPRPRVPVAALAFTVLLLAGAAHTARAETDREYCERQQGFAKDVCLRDLDKPAAKPKPAAAATPATTPTPAATPTTPAAAPAAVKPAAATAAAAPKPAAAGGSALYKVVGGDTVDAETLKGFRAWRAAACDRCHGANQEGLVGPSLITSLKTLSKDEFVAVVKNGRLEKGMQSFGNSPIVMDNINQLYAYLKGRSDGAITKAHVKAIQ